MTIQFLLKADINRFSNTIPVRTFYKFQAGKRFIDITGREAFEIDRAGMVDDEIKKVHEKEYLEFESYLERNAEKLYDQCRADTNLVVNVSDLIMAEKAQAAAQEAAPESEAPVEE